MKILLDMGHTLSGADTGAEGCGKREQDCTREIGYKVKTKLEALGNTVVVCSKDSCSSLTDSLSYRANTANNAGGDLYVALHLNAYNGNAYGTEVYTFGAKELKEARNVLNNIVALGYYNRGIKDGSKLYVIRHTAMPSMLIECCFIDNENDMNRYNSETLANAIVEGITGKRVNNKEEKPQESQEYDYSLKGKTGTVTASALNVRDGAGTGYKIIGQLANGKKVEIGFAQGDFYNIYFGDHGGWVHKNYIKLQSQYGVVTAKSGLKVRNGAGTGYKELGVLPCGHKVQIGFEQDGWYNIYFGDHGGFVSAEYIRLI